MKRILRQIGLIIAGWSMLGGLAAAQPTDLSARHQSGQTFITWTEQADLSGEQYNVYRHTEPITAQNLNQAVGLYAVPEGSGYFYANRYNIYSSGIWKVRYVERYVIEDNGDQLADGTGLLVWTLATNDFSVGVTGAA